MSIIRGTLKAACSQVLCVPRRLDFLCPGSLLCLLSEPSTSNFVSEPQLQARLCEGPRRRPGHAAYPETKKPARGNSMHYAQGEGWQFSCRAHDVLRSLPSGCLYSITLPVLTVTGVRSEGWSEDMKYFFLGSTEGLFDFRDKCSQTMITYSWPRCGGNTQYLLS